MFKFIFITSKFDNIYQLKKITNNILNEYKNQFCFKFFLKDEIDENKKKYNELIEESENADLISVLLHGGISNFKKFLKFKDEINSKIPFFFSTSIEDEMREFNSKSNLAVLVQDKLHKYYNLGGEKNYKNMILYAANSLGKIKYEVEDYEYPDFEGIVADGEVVKNTDIYLDEIAKKENIIGIIIHNKEWKNKKRNILKKFVEEIENLGAIPLVVFTNSIPNPELKVKGIKWVLENYFIRNNKVLPKCIINLAAYSQSIFQSPGDGSSMVDKSIFEDIGIPVIQAMGTYQDRKTWDNDIRGLDAMSLTSTVYYPEFDGQIISVTCCTHEIIEDEFGKTAVFQAIDERINKIVRMAIGWVSLANKKNEDKKIAIILHNMPPRNDMIGCAFGLDTPKSIYNMINYFSEIGIKIDYKFESGNEIIQKIIKTVTNDEKWLTAEKVLKNSVDKIETKKYLEWFLKLNLKVQSEMTEQWGKAPGGFMVYNNLFPVPGVLNGNIFIGLQPARGPIDKADELVHDTKFTIPHQYYSFYKWIKEEFKADAIYHVGTHGTLEWLPGKEIGLCDTSYPDINIDDIPHLYDYSINVTGEGLQAKRRSYAALISYMIPSLTLAGKYDDIEKMDELIKQYYQAKNLKDSKIEIIKADIIEKVFEFSYNLDMNISKEKIEEDYETFINNLHSYLEELKSSFIRDGLHILGEPEVEERCVNLIQALLRIDNCGMLGVDKAVAKTLGFDIDNLIDNPYEFINKKSNLMILDDIRNISTEIIRDILNFLENNITSDEIFKNSYNSYEVKEIKYLNDLKKNISEIILPKIKETVREKESTIKGVLGKFISPGESGNPTRGNINILPSGTNFYSIDPNKIPSRAAWKVGVNLAEQLINRYIKDENKFPQNIAMIIYSGETMKTNGDDVAEALYLMGVKPIWLESSDRVIGLEVIPYEKLKRPRIDVTLRITGLFRDTFPNLIKLIEEAVNLVSNLDESEEINFIKKNINDEVRNLLNEGYKIEEAEKLSRMRIFGCPPGTYGAGVGTMIYSKQWERTEDLGRQYINWSSYAYGSDFHGERTENSFIKRMKKSQITVKNESSIEIDMLDSDDYFVYHGGLVAAVKYASGEAPNSYTADTSNPERIKTKNLKEETARLMRARILNPKWIEGLKKHGYKGAQEVSSVVDIFFGWDATAGIAENWMYDKLTEKFIENTENREWLKENNPHAVMNITERLLEAYQRNMWTASSEKLEILRKIYLNIEGDIEEYEE